MPHITISVIAPNHEFDQDFISLDVAAELTLADLKGFVNAETNVPTANQQFYLNNVALSNDAQTLAEAGIKDGDMLAMLVREPSRTNNMGYGRRSTAAGSGPPGSQDGHRIETTRLQILGNQQAMEQMRQQRPALADAINDPNRFREVWSEMMREEEQRENERLEQLRLLDEDPLNPEAQQKIEEMIRQQSVQENLQFAYEHNPEVFARVTMLYIPVVVNKHPVKAFVDSGAQTTIMSPSCAEACGIMRLIDKRYAGVARGVGTAQILGRVHSADIRIGNSNMPCSFTVMEGKDVDLLLGLDMLKRFQAVIDLRRNKLMFGDDNEVEFLGEADIPRGFEDHEPTVVGPNGTVVGARTGTVKPAESSSASTTAPSASSFQGAERTIDSGSTPVKAPSSTAATQPPTTSGSAAGPASRVGGTSHSEQSIEQLVGLGFSKEEAIAALDACGGNVEYAAGLLFQG